MNLEHANTQLLYLLRLPEVAGRIRLGRSSIYSMIKAGTFPAPILLGKRCVAWREDEVEIWLRTRIEGARPLSKLAGPST